MTIKLRYVDVGGVNVMGHGMALARDEIGKLWLSRFDDDDHLDVSSAVDEIMSTMKHEKIEGRDFSHYAVAQRDGKSIRRGGDTPEEAIANLRRGLKHMLEWEIILTKFNRRGKILK